MKAASFGHFCRNWSATWRRIALAWARSGCGKAWRSAAATMLCWVFGTYARALRIQCTLCRRRHNVHYADLRIMPTGMRNPSSAAVIAAMGSA